MPLDLKSYAALEVEHLRVTSRMIEMRSLPLDMVVVPENARGLYLRLCWRRDSASLRKHDGDGLNLCPVLQLCLINFSRHTGATANTRKRN